VAPSERPSSGEGVCYVLNEYLFTLFTIYITKNGQEMSRVIQYLKRQDG